MIDFKVSSMLKYLRAAPLLLASLPMIAAGAEDQGAALRVPPLRFEGSLAKVDGKVSALFGDETQKTLRQVAEASVLSDYCAAINLDQVAFKKAFAELSDKAIKGSREQQQVYQNKLSMYFGVYVGLLVAEGAERRAEFCGLAEEALKARKPISRFWIATADAPKTPNQ